MYTRLSFLEKLNRGLVEYKGQFDSDADMYYYCENTICNFTFDIFEYGK